jgi:DeoR/GlpR family transcriptional regulator of sugar metabolism
VVVTDSSKLGRRAFARICGIDRVDLLVTDTAVPAEAVTRFGEAGVKVLTV